MVGAQPLPDCSSACQLVKWSSRLLIRLPRYAHARSDQQSFGSLFVAVFLPGLFLGVPTRWAPTTCISRFMTFMTLLRGVLTPLTTGGGPTLYQPQPTWIVPSIYQPQQKSFKKYWFCCCCCVVWFNTKKHSTLLNGFFVFSSSGRRSRRPPNGWRKKQWSRGKNNISQTLHGTGIFTPWKINMEHTNHPFRKENDLPNLYDYVPC